MDGVSWSAARYKHEVEHNRFLKLQRAPRAPLRCRQTGAVRSDILAEIFQLPQARAGRHHGPAPAYAGSKDIQELAHYTGLTERKVQMILGCHSCYPEYRYNYQRSLKQFKEALGEENFEELMTGRPITLDNGTKNLLQTNAAVNPGNSGGGLFDRSGNLIGIVEAKTSAVGIEGIAFAIPINDAKPIVEELKSRG